MKKTSLIIKKELFRVFGDRKMIFSLYVLPLLVVIIMYSLMGKLIGSVEKDINEHKSVVTMVNAPDNIKGVMDKSGYSDTSVVEFIDTATYNNEKIEYNSSILNGVIDLLVVFDDDFKTIQDEYVNGGDAIPGIKVFYNSTENYSSNSYSVFSTVLLEAYKADLLTQRFGDASLVNAINVESEIICKEEQANAQFISMMLPYMIVMMLFAGVMSVGVDAIAGEKERGTLSSMLISPVKRSEIVWGKLISMGILSGISAVVYCVSMIAASYMMGSSGIGEMGFGGIKLGANQIIELVLMMLSLVFLYVGIIGIISVLSTNTKTAGSALSPCYIVIVLAGMATMFRTGAKPGVIQYMIPVYGNALAISDICKDSLELVNFFASFSVTFVLAVVLTLLIARAFESEKLMFNA